MDVVARLLLYGHWNRSYQNHQLLGYQVKLMLDFV